MASDPYSRLVAFLKVALPLLALAILSTLFLVSSRIEPGDSIPFAEGEIAERIRGQQVTGPVFSGMTSGGDRISFTAEQLNTVADGTNSARNPTAMLDFLTGGSVRIDSDRGDFDLDGDLATMSGNVVVTSTTGYVMRTDTLETRLSKVDIVSPGEVRATGPAGRLTAGSMHITEEAGSEDVQLLFTNGVKLIYEPKEAE